MTRRQMMAAMLAGAAPGATVAPDENDQPDEDALPIPESGPAPPPLVNPPPPKGYSPPYGPPPYGQPRAKMLAAALAGGAAGVGTSSPQTGLPPSNVVQPAPQGAHYAQLPGPPLLLAGNDTQGAPPPPVQTGRSAAPSQQTSDVGAQEDETAARYKAQHDSSVAAYNRAIAMAQQTAGTPASAVYLKIAEEAAKAANDVNLKGIEYNARQTRAPTDAEAARIKAIGGNPDEYQVSSGKFEPISVVGKTQILADEQLTPAEREAGGEWTVDTKTGARSQVSATAPTEDTTEIQNYKFDQQNRQAQGLPPISFSDWNVEKTQARSGISPLTAADGKPIDPSLSGHAVIAAVSPEVGRMAQAMIEGRQPIPNLSVRTDPVTRQAVMAAQQADGSLEVGNPTARIKVRNEFLTGGLASPAGRMTAGNNAINHLDEANYYAQELHDLGFDSLNAIWNAVTPGSSPVAKALAGYKNAISNAAGEVVKFNTGSEGALQDRQERAAQMGPNLTFGERKTALESQVGILASNMVSLQKRWRDGMGPLVPDFDTIHPDALAAIERIKGEQPYPPPGGLPPSMRAGGAPQGAAAAPRNVAPGVTGAMPSADPLSAARDAISRGAPRDAVIQRLKKNGIDPKGL